LEIDPEFYHSYYDLGDTYLQKKDYSNAIENYKIFLQHYPTKYRLHSVIGDAYIAISDSVNAKKHSHLADSLKNLRK
jgi:tetratricopeptide (TPR) repeat protein